MRALALPVHDPRWDGGATVVRRAAGVLVVLAMLCAARSAAQTTVGRDVRVRATPESHGRIIGRIAKGTALTVVGRDTLRNGYLHVRAPQAVGWVWALFIKRSAPVETRPDSSPLRRLSRRLTPPTMSMEGPVWEVSPGWPAPAPTVSTISTSIGPCPAGGSGPHGAAARDTFTNARKNRTDVPREVHPVSFEGMVGLWAPAEHRRFFQTFSAGARDSLRMFGGRGVRVEGYLADVKPEKDEQTNCGARDSTEVDWHMYLVEHPQDSLRRSVIVEASPRVRPAHRWTLKTLQAVRRRERVRITGWLLFDPEHFDAVDGYVTAAGTPGAHPWRATLWEVHPVTRIEVCRTGRWTDLDGGPPGEPCTS